MCGAVRPWSRWMTSIPSGDSSASSWSERYTTSSVYPTSDASPLVGYTDEVVYLSDHELALLSPEGMEVIHRDHGRTAPHITVLDQTAGDSELGEFAHYML